MSDDQINVAVAELSTDEREWRLLYSCIVAGKSAVFADGVVSRMRHALEIIKGTPFQKLAALKVEQIETILRGARSGNYGKLAKCFDALCRDSSLNLLTCTPADLEKFHGIGPKTSRFFIIWTRPEEKYAALDVHVLRWLRTKGHAAPKSTPSGPLYAKLEAIFINEAEAIGMTPRELDYQIWNNGAKYE